MRFNLWELSQIRDLQLNFENCGNTMKYKKYRLIRFLYKTTALQHHKNLNPIFEREFDVSKNFLKV